MGANRTCQPGGHYWDFYPGTLSIKASHCSTLEDQGTRRFHLRVPDLQMSCRAFAT